MNQQVRALATVVKLEPLYVVDDTAVRWQGKSNAVAYVDAFGPDARGDSLNVKFPISKATLVSKAAAKFIAKAKSNVVVNALVHVPTDEMEQYLKAGPFDDGSLDFRIESTIAKPVQKSLTGQGAPFIGFCPAYDYSDKKGPIFLVCFQADESSAECIIGISNEDEPLNPDVFRAFVKKAGLSKIFSELNGAYTS